MRTSAAKGQALWVIREPQEWPSLLPPRQTLSPLCQAAQTPQRCHPDAGQTLTGRGVGTGGNRESLTLDVARLVRCQG